MSPRAMKGKRPDYHLDKVERWPYPWRVYLGRFLWLLIQATAWKLCWSRVIMLRPLLLRLFGSKTSLRCLISGGVRIEMPWLLQTGHPVCIGPRVGIYNLGGLVIGDDVVISQDAYLCGGTHDHRDPRMALLRKEIVIGDKVWICAGAFIGPGVKIGEGAVVGARAVVMKDVKPWTIVAGNPAKIIGSRRMNLPKGGRKNGY
jgi:putative colanic acid biosynthesis acetyltransferase WcaF